MHAEVLFVLRTVLSLGSRDILGGAPWVALSSHSLPHRIPPPPTLSLSLSLTNRQTHAPTQLALSVTCVKPDIFVDLQFYYQVTV